MVDRSRYTTTLSFIDFLFNLVIALTALFLLAILLINPPRQETTQKREAEYFIVIKWQDFNSNDVDLWVTDGTNTTSFINRQHSNMSLDRDDVGPDDPITHTHFLPKQSVRLLPHCLSIQNERCLRVDLPYRQTIHQGPMG